MAPLEDHNHHPVTINKDMKIYDLLDKEYKIAVLREPNGPQENKKDNSMKSATQYINKMRSLTER